MRKIAYIVMLLSLFITGCSVSKKYGEDRNYHEEIASEGKSIESIIANNLSNSDFYIQKADINLIQNNTSVRFTASIKYRKPDTLLITVRSRTGMEAGRSLITRDTIIINDRINKKILVGSPSVIGPKYGVEPSMIFVVIGDIVIDEKDNNTMLDCNKGIYVHEFETQGKKVNYIIDCKERKAMKAYIGGDFRSTDITISFDDIVHFANVKFPSKISISDDLNSVKIVLEIKKIESPWSGKISFVPGSGYKISKIK